MAWLLLLVGAALLVWGLRGLSAHARKVAGSEERLQRLAGELADAGEAVLHAADTRLAELEEAVAAADRRLAALLQAQAGAGSSGRSDAAPAGAPAAGSGPDAAPAPAPAAVVPPEHRAVWGLSDLGHSETEIARETGILAGEVRLILGLRRLQGR